MRKFNNTIMNCILAVGMLLLFGGCLILVATSTKLNSIAVNVWPMLFFILGLAFLYVSIAFTKRPYQLFLAILTTLMSGFSMLFVEQVIPFGISQWWPIYGILVGLSLILTCLYKHHKLRVHYFVPSIAMIAMGSACMLFSFDVIKTPLSKVFLIAGPVLMIMAGIVIIVLFLFLGAHKEFVVEDGQPDDFE